MPPKLEFTERKVSQLAPHPKQHQCFEDLPDAELQQLAESMRKCGLNHAIEILPDDTIICGHQRVRAARLLGWDDIDVIIRHDLAAAGDEAVEERLVEDNLIRRQLTPLERVRCATLIAGRRSDWRVVSAQRDRVATLLHVSLKTATRLLQVALTPTAVQHAYDLGHLPLVLAVRVYHLPVHVQAEIADEIEVAGFEGAKDIVKSHFPSDPPRQLTATDHYRILIHDIRRAHDALHRHVSEIEFDKILVEGDIKVLSDGEQLLHQLSAAVESVRPERSTGHDVQSIGDQVDVNSVKRDRFNDGGADG